jgi:hypothetical protein
MSGKITVITEGADVDGVPFRFEYAGVLVGSTYAFYVDKTHNVAILERVYRRGSEYATTGGYGSIRFEIDVADPSLIDHVAGMSALQLLAKLSETGGIR